MITTDRLLVGVILLMVVFLGIIACDVWPKPLKHVPVIVQQV